MSFMGPGSEAGMWSDIGASAIGPMFGPIGSFATMIPKMRSEMQTRKLAEAGIKTSGIMAGREGMRRAAMEQRLKRQRKKDLYAQGALETRMGNVALQGRPRAGGSVLGGRGR